MRNRSDALRNPGGDTVLMERLREGLVLSGHKVDWDLDSTADSGGYDVIHLFNLTLPELVLPSAIEASAHGVPFVIHPLLEDWPRFHNRALGAAVILQKYVASGQMRARLDPALAMLRDCPPAGMPICAQAVQAASLLCTGEEELRTVERMYPGARTDLVPLGAWSASPDAKLPGEFPSAFGVTDFVLCVGRLEPRKNQLMLLAALEEEDITVVFADGGVSYDPAYAEACRNFARRGRTIFTGRMTAPMLASAYGTASVSCFPSWYELPGLATLEAARLGRNVVASPWGTLRDYLGNSCRYAEPDDYKGLRTAILEARDSLPSPDLRAAATRFTWENTVRATEAVYLRAAGRIPA
jgi:glycosyltransferase involved in cell wall biosynthesis